MRGIPSYLSLIILTMSLTLSLIIYIETQIQNLPAFSNISNES